MSENLDKLYNTAMEMYNNGNPLQAVKYFEKSADMSNAEAQFKLAVLYHGNTGDPLDAEKALKLYRQSAQQGYDEAQYVLGLYYKDDLTDIPNVNIDFAKSAEWFKKAAVQNHTGALFHLALLYRNGDGVPKDNIKSIKLCHKAAQQGHDYAQFILGLYYSGGLKGMGEAAKDIAKAIEWFKKSAEQGNEEAKAELEALKKTQ